MPAGRRKLGPHPARTAELPLRRPAAPFRRQEQRPGWHTLPVLGTRKRLVVAVVVVLAGVVGAVGFGLRGTERAGAAYAQPAHLQVVTVSVPSATSTVGTVEAWSWQAANGKFKRVAVFPSARVGAGGVGAASEGSTRTPAGYFRISQPFGVAANPGTIFPYLKVDINDVWTGSRYPATGNRHARCAPGACPATYQPGERLISYPSQYKYAAFIGYNAPRPYGAGVVANKGSAFFLHVKNASATAGCVAVAESQMVWLLRWLRPGSGPAISIGVGSAAYAPIPNRYL